MLDDEKAEFRTASSVHCENCGADLIFDADAQAISCNFCGHALHINAMRRIEVIEPDLILPFKTNGDTFRAAALKWLITGEYVPVDVISRANFSDNLGVYIPCVFYKGSFTAQWSAQVGVSRQETVLVKRGNELRNETKTRIDYYPQNGPCHGEFSFVACASRNLSEQQKAFIENLSFDGSENFDERLTLGFVQENLTSETNYRNLFDKRVHRSLENLMQQRVRGMISGEHVKDIRYSHQFSIDNASSFLMPIWLLPYDYDDKKYSIIMSGRNTSEISGSKPEDVHQKNRDKIPFIISGAITALGGAGYIYQDTGVARDISTGIFWSGLFLLLSAWIYKRMRIKLRHQLRARALEAYQNGSSFDLLGEMAEQKAQPFSPVHLWYGSWLVAVIIMVAIAVGMYVSPSDTPTTPTSSETASSSSSPTETESQPVTETPQSTPSETETAAPQPADNDNAQVPTAPDAPVQPEEANTQPQSPPQRRYPSSPNYSQQSPYGVPQRTTSDGGQVSGIVRQTMLEAKACLNQENYDCAEADLHTVLRIDPANDEAASLLQYVSQKRKEALQSNWNAH